MAIDLRKARGYREVNKLVKQSQRGDADAFVELIEENKTSLYRVAKGILHNEEDIADAMQETVLDSFEHIRELKKSEFFKTWITRILINNCNQILQRRKRCDVLEEFPEIESRDGNQAELEFQQMLDTLSEDSRLIFQLYYGEGYNAREISELLHQSENTVKSRLRRGRSRIRKEVLEG